MCTVCFVLICCCFCCWYWRCWLFGRILVKPILWIPRRFPEYLLLLLIIIIIIIIFLFVLRIIRSISIRGRIVGKTCSTSFGWYFNLYPISTSAQYRSGRRWWCYSCSYCSYYGSCCNSVTSIGRCGWSTMTMSWWSSGCWRVCQLDVFVVVVVAFVTAAIAAKEKSWYFVYMY